MISCARSRAGSFITARSTLVFAVVGLITKRLGDLIDGQADAHRRQDLPAARG
jgi:hypothetical protein